MLPWAHSQLVDDGLDAFHLLRQLLRFAAHLVTLDFTRQGDDAVLHLDRDARALHIAIARQADQYLVVNLAVAGRALLREQRSDTQRKRQQYSQNTHHDSTSDSGGSAPTIDRQSIAFRNSGFSRQFGCTFTNNSRNTFCPRSDSICSRAAVPTFFRAAPLAPVTIAFCPGRSTYPVPAMRTIFGVSSHLWMSTATACGSSCRVSSRIFSRIIPPAR